MVFPKSSCLWLRYGGQRRPSGPPSSTKGALRTAKRGLWLGRRRLGAPPPSPPAPNPRSHPPARRCPAAFEPCARRHVRVQAVALQLCSAPGFVSMWIRLVVIGSRHPSSPSCAYRRETNVDVRCAQDPQTDRLRRRRLERFLMGLIVETGAVPPAPFPSRPLRPASRTSCLKFTFCRR